MLLLRALRVALVACSLAAAVGQAVPASAQTLYQTYNIYPGEAVTNTVNLLDADGTVVAGSSVTFEVAPVPADGTLRVFEPANGRSASDTLLFRQTDYLYDGTFLPVNAPVDISGSRQPVDISRPLEVVETDSIRPGVPLFYVLVHDALNLRSDRIDTAVIGVVDSLTGDREILRLYETDPDSGVFGGWIGTDPGAATLEDGSLATNDDAVIEATWADQYDETNTLYQDVNVVALAASGIVFDSVTGAVVNGARLTLVDAATGALATVFGEDRRSPFPASITSGGTVRDSSGRLYNFADGAYRFPYLPAGTYRLVVAPPPGYVAPSTRSEAEINAVAPPGMAVAPGSRAEAFVIAASGPVILGVPLDRVRIGRIERDGSLSEAEPGDFITYTVTIEPPPSDRIDIRDVLPPGIVFVPGTLRIDGVPVAVRETAQGFVIEGFAVGGGEIVMTYLAQITLGAEVGDSFASTTTVTEAGTGAMSMSDDHVLEVTTPFGEEDTVILGQVIAGPCGGEPEDRDLSGIRILLESGDMAVTDSEGRFHFQSIAARPRVVQMDATTLPRHASPVLCRRDTRNAGSPISQFVDLRSGFMARVEFHVEFDDGALAAETAHELDLADVAMPTNLSVAFDAHWLARQGSEPAPALLTPAQGWVPSSEAIDVVVLTPRSTVAELRLNGELVEDLLREPPVVDPDSGAALVRWRAVRIEEGRNLLTLSILDAEGNEVHHDARTIHYETTAFGAELVTAGSVLESDGRTTPILQLRILGHSGGPLRPGTRVQFRVDEPFGFENPVERESQPTSWRGPVASTSATVGENGLVRLRLAPIRETGTARIVVVGSGDEFRDEVAVDVPISAASRPWVLVGLAEGTVAERTIRDHMRRSGDIGNDLAGRVALFAEGVVSGRWLLTLRVDTAREGTGPFSGIDPERDYVVYGDASYQDDASPSRFPLYLRLRSEEAEFLLGDLTAEIDTRLVDVSREVTGLRVVHETATHRVMALAARTTQRWVEDRIALDGTSGPYQLSRDDIVPRSETVALLVVDGDDISRVISEEPLVAGQDYVLSPSSGRLFLRRPVPAFTPELDRYVLRVGYETDEEVERGLLAAIRAERQVGETVRVGATVVRAENANGGTVDVTLLGADIAVRLSDALTVGAEILEAHRVGPDSSMRSRAATLYADYDDGDSNATLSIRRQDGDTSLDSTMNDARIDSLGVDGEVRLWGHGDEEHPDDGVWLAGEANVEHDRGIDRRTAIGQAELVRRADGLETGMGLRFFDETDPEGERRALQATTRLGWAPEEGRLSYGVELREPLSAAGGVEAEREVRLQMAFEAADQLALTATWDGASPVGNEADSGILTFGADWGWGEDGELSAGVASAYGDGPRDQALFLGLDKGWELTPGLELSWGLDIQRDLGATDIPLGLQSGNPWIATSFTAVRAGLRYTDETWSMGLDTEARTAPEGDRANVRLSGDGELGADWTFGAEARYGVAHENGEERRDTEARLSFAHRPGEHEPITLLNFEMDGSLEDGTEARRLEADLLHSRYLGEAGELTLRGALRAVRTGHQGATASDTLTLAGIEYRHDLSETWDIGFNSAASASSRTGDLRTSYGVSLGLTPFENGYLQIGYNIEGFEDEDFSKQGYTDRGVFVEYRVKFDQETFQEAFR